MSLTRRLRWAAVATGMVLLVSACGGSGGSGGSAKDAAFTLYSGRAEELLQPLIDRYTKETGVEIDVRYGDSAEMAAQLLEEGDGTPADVFYSQEVGAIGALAKADLLGSLPRGVVDRADERFRPAQGTSWVGVTGRSRVIVYNPDLVPSPPKGALDLTDAAYRDQVAWAPGNAGFQAFMTSFRVSRGEAAATQWLADMQANGATVFENNLDILDAVESGEQPMGLINHYYWSRLAAEVGGPQNMKSKLVFPAGDDPGGLVNATAIGVTAQGETNQEAQAFVKYLLSEAGQQYFVEENYEYPVVAGVADPPGVPPLDQLEGPQLDLSDLDSLQETQAMLTEAGLLS